MDINSTSEKEMVIDYKSYKWIVSSCFQKSLRRGRFDLASSYLKFLWEHEKSYICYRFATILSEDVGISNIELVNRYLDTNLAQKKIDEAGGLDFLLQVTKEACESVKDRSSCDAANFAYYENYPHDLSQKTENEIIQFLHQQLEETSVSYLEKIQSLWILLGNKKFDSPTIPFPLSHPLNEKNEKIDHLERYKTGMEKMGLSSEFITASLNSYNTQRENIFLGIPVVEQLYMNEKNDLSFPNSKFKPGDTIENMYVKEETFLHSPTGLNLISCGVDGHTREGRNVYSKYLSQKNAFTDYLKSKNIPFESYSIIFSHCMFRTEGHEVNKRIYFPTAVNIMRDCEQRILDIKLGMGKNHLSFTELKKILISEMPTINSLREKAIITAKPNMIEKPVPKIKKKKDKNAKI